VRVAQRLKRQLNQARCERDHGFEECDRLKDEREQLLVLTAAYEAVLGTVLSPGDKEA